MIQMTSKLFLINTLLLFLYVQLSCNDTDKKAGLSELTTDQRDSVYTGFLLKHLRQNFDDIHDVSMRFHHLDHTLNGLIILNLQWKDGKLKSASVMENETGSENFANSLIEKIKQWHIAGIQEQFDINLPLQIKIVGSDDSTFTSKSIFSGEVVSRNGEAISGAKISFHSGANTADSIAACYSNREGIFVRTLIPPGSWHIHCTHSEYKKVIIVDIDFKAGEHHRQKIVLDRR